MRDGFSPNYAADHDLSGFHSRRAIAIYVHRSLCSRCFLFTSFKESVQPNTSCTLPVIVVKGKEQSLLGRNWLEKIREQWQKIFKVDGKGSDTSSLAPDTKRKLRGTLQRHDNVFRERLGTYTGPKVNIKMDATCTPKFFKARAAAVPYAQREAVEKEL